MIKINQSLVIFSASLFPLICILFGKGYNYASILLLLSALLSFFPFYKQKLSRDSFSYISILLLYFITLTLSVIYSDNSISDLDNPSRAILVIPIFIALIRAPLRIKHLAIGLILGSFVVGMIAVYHQVNYPGSRAFSGELGEAWMDGYMPIQTGGMATTLSVSCLVLSLYLLKKKSIFFSFLALMGSMFAIYASILSGSRGSWLFLPVVVVYLLYVNRYSVSKRMFTLLILFFLSLGFIGSQVHVVKKRVNTGVNDIYLYISGEKKDTSLGIRLELWKSAVYTFTEYPIFGVGTKDRQKSRNRHGELGLIDLKVSKKTYHAHNQFLESLSMYGIVGFIGLLGVLFGPLYLFEKVRKRNLTPELSAICQLGSTSVIMMIGYCMTQSFFNHNSGIIYYVVFTSILMAIALSGENAPTSREVECS